MGVSGESDALEEVVLPPGCFISNVVEMPTTFKQKSQGSRGGGVLSTYLRDQIRVLLSPDVGRRLGNFTSSFVMHTSGGGGAATVYIR